MREPSADSLEPHLYRLETGLLETSVRRDPVALAGLLAEEFYEFGSSGRIHSRQDVLEFLAAESPARFSVSDFSVTTVAAGVALVRYQATRHSESGQANSMSLRSSLWVLRDGQWRMLFHQGTKAGGDLAGGSTESRAPAPDTAPGFPA